MASRWYQRFQSKNARLFGRQTKWEWNGEYKAYHGYVALYAKAHPATSQTPTTELRFYDRAAAVNNRSATQLTNTLAASSSGYVCVLADDVRVSDVICGHGQALPRQLAAD